MDFGHLLSSSFFHFGVPRNPEHFLLFLLLTAADFDPKGFTLGMDNERVQKDIRL